MRRASLCLCVVFLFAAVAGWPATNNSGNAPTFLWLDICTNGVGDNEAGSPIPRMAPDVLDVGVDLGADGTVDRWLSGETTEYLGRDNADAVSPGAFRRYLIRLDSDAGSQAKVTIVDNSADYYIAVAAIRLNYADGDVVPNLVPNGFFEDSVPLNGWTVTAGSISDPAQLIVRDTVGDQIFYGSQYYSTLVNGFDDTATIVSDTFTLTPPTSFVYGMVSGGGSELWNIPGWGGSDNASGVYLDVGTASADPNGTFDQGTDVPLTGFYGGTADSVRNQIHPVFLNTSGLEGRRAQIVAIDNSEAFHVGLDSWRMNWDSDHIPNGGFDQDIPDEWDRGAPLPYNEHPSGGIPGWTPTLTDPPDAEPWYYDEAVHDGQFSGRAFVGTAGASEDWRAFTGLELRSSVFVIEPIPDPASNVFMQFASAQGTSHARSADDLSSIELHVDVNGNGEFGDAGDFIYKQRDQGMGWCLNTSNMDLWHYPEYRFYIAPEHQGMQAQIFCIDTVPNSYGWMCVDDFYVWDGTEARLPFPNSDFEQGTVDGTAEGEIINWTAEVTGGTLTTWLSGSWDFFLDGKVTHQAMNNRKTDVDGNYAADTADNANGGGDNGEGTLTSIAFALPSLQPVPVADWSLY